MTSRNKFKYLIILGILIAGVFALADSLGYFNPKSYTKVSKGSHAHYVPDNRDPDVSITRFPKEPPGPDEKISPKGKIIKTSVQKQEKRTPTEKSEKKPSVDNEIRTIEIIGTDQMKFVVKEEGKGISTGRSFEIFTGESYMILNNIKAKPGERIRIRLKTLSQLKSDMMSHNWVLLDKDADTRAFVSEAKRDNNYIPSGWEEDIIADTGLVADGESAEIIFTAPEETGRYDFLCSFMSHFAAGMQGTLIVKS